MSDKINRYRLKVAEGAEVPHRALLECKRSDGFPNYGSASNKRREIVEKYQLDPAVIEIKIRR